MRMTFLMSLALVAMSAVATAQEQASTLAEACRQSDLIVCATVTAATDPSPQWHRLEFRVDAVLAGTFTGTLQLLEPAGACCGRSLFALPVGAPCLLFLQRRGPTLHAFAGGRGVLAQEPEVVQHVRALLAAGAANATPGAAVTDVLVAGLVSPTPRIATDAALALASWPNLQLGAAARNVVAEQLQLAVRSQRTTTPALADVVVRSGDATLLETALQTYLDAPQPDQALALRRHLLAAGHGNVVARLMPLLDRNLARQLRAAELLADIPYEHTAAPLRILLRDQQHPRVSLCVAESMLAAGHRSEHIADLVPAAVLRLAEQRQRAPKTFRSVNRTQL